MSFPHKITIQKENKPIEDLYKTTLYGGTDALLDNTVPVDDTDGFTSDIEIKDEKTAAKISFRYAAVGSDIVDEPVFTLYNRIDNNIWEGKESSIDTIQRSNDGSEKIYIYTITDWTHGAGYYRFALQSSGGTTEFNAHVTIKCWTQETFGS